MNSTDGVDCISFVVPGKIAGKARPRVVRPGTSKPAYNPDPYGYEERVGYHALDARPDDFILWLTPVGLKVKTYRLMPKSWSKKRRNANRLKLCGATPDYPNIVAAVADGLNHVLYSDDRLVAIGYFEDRWDDEERTEITAWRIIEQEEDGN